MVKKLLGIELPLVAGSEAHIYMEDGGKYRTFPRKISEVRYSSNVLYVTFATTHSVYTSPIKIITGPQKPIEGQVIREGSEVWNSEGGREYIDGIIEIREDGIGVRTKTGIFKGKVKLESYKPV